MNVYKICTDLGLFSRRPRLISRPWPWLDSSTPHGELILTVMGGAGSTSSSASSSGNVAMRASSEPRRRERNSGAHRCSIPANARKSLSATLMGRQWPSWRWNTIAGRPRSGGLCGHPVRACTHKGGHWANVRSWGYCGNRPSAGLDRICRF